MVSDNNEWNEEDAWIDMTIQERNPIQRDKIFVKNIPNELNRDGLKNMFGKYGKIIDISKPEDKKFAFITYESIADAETCLRRFNEDYPLKISVEFAKAREVSAPAPVNYDFVELERAMEIKPFRNRLEKSKRKIQGPFSDPTQAHLCDSLILDTDYRNLSLKLIADPFKQFLWNSNDEANIDCDITANKQIVHGRAILKSSLNANGKDVSKTNSSEKKSFTFNSDLLQSMPSCGNCSRPADKLCKNCQKNVCALECHAASCTNPSKTDINPSANSKVFRGRTIDRIVKITAVINHRMVFIRPATKNDDIEFIRLILDTDRYAKDAAILKSMPVIGQLVLAKFDYYQRALVLKKVDENRVAVAFIDFGNVEIRDFHELKFMPDKLNDLDRFATRIELTGIDHDIISDEALKVLYHYMAQGAELKFERDASNKEMGSLKASDKWINQLINKMNTKDIIRPTAERWTERSYIENSLQMKAIDCEKMAGVEVIILDNSTVALKNLSFILAEDLKLFRQNDRRIQNICNYLFPNDEYYTPMENECCVVRVTVKEADSAEKIRWFRAYCVEICSDGFATMQFIDYGNINTIEILDIRPIPQSLLFDYITITPDCFVDRIGDLTTEDINEYQKRYSILSRQTIDRIEKRIEKSFLDENDHFYYVAWLR